MAEEQSPPDPVYSEQDLAHKTVEFMFDRAYEVLYRLRSHIKDNRLKDFNTEDTEWYIANIRLAGKMLYDAMTYVTHDTEDHFEEKDITR